MFLDTSGSRPPTSQYRSDGTSAETVWQQLIAPHCNVFLVLNGHYQGVNGEARRVDNNAAGSRCTSS